MSLSFGSVSTLKSGTGGPFQLVSHVFSFLHVAASAMRPGKDGSGELAGGAARRHGPSGQRSGVSPLKPIPFCSQPNSQEDGGRGG